MCAASGAPFPRFRSHPHPLPVWPWARGFALLCPDPHLCSRVTRRVMRINSGYDWVKCCVGAGVAAVTTHQGQAASRAGGTLASWSPGSSLSCLLQVQIPLDQGLHLSGLYILFSPQVTRMHICCAKNAGLLCAAWRGRIGAGREKKGRGENEVGGKKARVFISFFILDL